VIERGSAVLVMGVSGSGKSTLGRKLAQVLDVPFLEGDDFHPSANVRKMRRGIALEDEDRWPWLDAVSAAVTARRTDAGIVATCSALKRSYRDRLREAIASPLLFACLTADRAFLAARLKLRQNHFMPESLLDSQLATLETPGSDEPARLLAADQPLDALIARLLIGGSNDSTTSPQRTAGSS
jgi:gluconokinase